MRTADMEIERRVCTLVEKLCDLCCHVRRTPSVNSGFKIEGVNALWFYVFLSDTCRGESVCFQDFWDGLHIFMRTKPVYAVAVSVLSVCVAVLSREDTCTAHGARGTRTEGVVKDDTAFGECINVWGSDDIISVTLCNTAPIVSDDEHHVFI